MNFPDRGLPGPTHNSPAGSLTDSGGVILVGFNETIIFFSFFTIIFLPVFAEPILTDNEYAVEEYVSGLEMPTTMTFIDNDILILQKKMMEKFSL